MSPSGTLPKRLTLYRSSAGTAKRVTPYRFRHSFATHLLENHYDIRTVQVFLGHRACPEQSRRSVNTTMVYTHVFNRGCLAVRSPLDSPTNGVELATDSYRCSVLNWQDKRVHTWRCDSPITLFEVTPIQCTAAGRAY